MYTIFFSVYISEEMFFVRELNFPDTRTFGAFLNKFTYAKYFSRIGFTANDVIISNYISGEIDINLEDARSCIIYASLCSFSHWIYTLRS